MVPPGSDFKTVGLKIVWDFSRFWCVLKASGMLGAAPIRGLKGIPQGLSIAGSLEDGGEGRKPE
ncbi:MAG: hypothetical protein BMS9Abin36_2175 [Gammaproteobacteria bacterium]|nr:MAG: hypothetical protein BMS9Abin36_2175 [Gammaproteobacteria bacterium]